MPDGELLLSLLTHYSVLVNPENFAGCKIQGKKHEPVVFSLHINPMKLCRCCNPTEVKSRAQRGHTVVHGLLASIGKGTTDLVCKTLRPPSSLLASFFPSSCSFYLISLSPSFLRFSSLPSFLFFHSSFFLLPFIFCHLFLFFLSFSLPLSDRYVLYCYPEPGTVLGAVVRYHTLMYLESLHRDK